jgi:predicted AlkP superfamily phosphohydrolase/phosphomutase
MESGSWMRLLSTSAILSNEPWPSFNTGVNPGQHGLYNYLAIKRGTNQIVRINGRYVPYFPFWWHLRNAGKKVAVFDVPRSYPLSGLDGLQVCNWGEHYPLLPQSSLPVELVREVCARFGGYPHPDEATNPGAAKELRLYRTMLANVERKLRATQFLLAQEDWDLFISVFGEAHYGAHQLYHHAEPTHWAHDPAAAATLQSSLATLYSRIDSALAELHASLPTDTTFLVVSVHGIAPNFSGNHLMPTVFERLGLHVPPPDAARGRSRQGSATERLRGLLPMSVRSFVNERVVPQAFHDRVSSQRFATSFDWTRSKAFFLPSDHFEGFVSVNLRGREPYGIVEPGTEYDRVCQDIESELEQLTNPQTGRPAVRRVVRIRNHYHGIAVDSLPDLVVQWSDEAFIGALHHPRLGTVSGEPVGLRRSQHGPEGFLIGSGPRIKSHASVPGANTMDVAPTVLHLMGQPVPQEMDGRVLTELLDDHLTACAPPRYDDRPFLVPEEMRV